MIRMYVKYLQAMTMSKPPSEDSMDIKVNEERNLQNNTTMKLMQNIEI